VKSVGALITRCWVVVENESEDELRRYARVVGEIMHDVYVEIMEPIYEQYTDLMPAELRG
jgi:hypothetical protein